MRVAGPVVHPLIRLLVFLAAAVLTPMAGAAGIGVAAALLAALWALARRPPDAGAWRAVRRLRWLLLSLFVLYGWFTPGQYLQPAWGALSPTLEGLALGLERAAVLVLIALGAHLLMASTPRAALVAALGLLAPRNSPFALRLVLTLEALAPAQERLAPVCAPGRRPAERWERLARALAEGEDGALAPASVQRLRLGWPAPAQWAWLGLVLPLVLLAGGPR